MVNHELIIDYYSEKSESGEHPWFEMENSGRKTTTAFLHHAPAAIPPLLLPSIISLASFSPNLKLDLHMDTVRGVYFLDCASVPERESPAESCPSERSLWVPYHICCHSLEQQDLKVPLRNSTYG